MSQYNDRKIGEAQVKSGITVVECERQAMLGLALTILEHRYPSQRPLVTRVGLLVQGTSMWLSRYVFEWYFGQTRQAMRARSRPLDVLRRGRSRTG